MIPYCGYKASRCAAHSQRSYSNPQTALRPEATWVIRCAFFVATMLALASLHARTPADDPEGRVLLQEAQRSIAAYHDGHRDAPNVLRVVYFHPADLDPLPNYAERLDRVMNDISDFYRDGLRRFGIENNGLPLERKDGKLVLHVVRGQKPTSGYRYESGDETEAEIREALRGTIDFDREFVLVLYGLRRIESDGRYVFNAPYYGDARCSQVHGLGHAADCDLLDPLLLRETGKKIVYTEHYRRMEQTVAAFNSWYLGGIAHELGHGLGLGHDAGSRAERSMGTSLMGVGNFTYRADRWGGGAPAYLSRASALQLASHPLFTGSNRGRWEEVGDAFDWLTFSKSSHGLRIEGSIGSRIPAYAVVAYAWPANGDEHDAISFPVIVRDGAFQLIIEGLGPERYNLRLASLHVNGGTSLPHNVGGLNLTQPDITALNNFSYVWRAEAAIARKDPTARRLVADDVIAHAPTTEIQRRLRILRATLDPRPPVETH